MKTKNELNIELERLNKTNLGFLKNRGNQNMKINEPDGKYEEFSKRFESWIGRLSWIGDGYWKACNRDFSEFKFEMSELLTQDNDSNQNENEIDNICQKCNKSKIRCFADAMKYDPEDFCRCKEESKVVPKEGQKIDKVYLNSGQQQLAKDIRKTIIARQNKSDIGTLGRIYSYCGKQIDNQHNTPNTNGKGEIKSGKVNRGLNSEQNVLCKNCGLRRGNHFGRSYNPCKNFVPQEQEETRKGIDLCKCGHERRIHCSTHCHGNKCVCDCKEFQIQDESVTGEKQ